MRFIGTLTITAMALLASGPVSADNHSAADNTPAEAQAGGADLRNVFRTLAKQAGVKLTLDAAVRGTVSASFTDKTPLEAMKAIAASKGLRIEQFQGTYYILPVGDRPQGHALEADRQITGPQPEPSVARSYDAYLDYMALPDTAKKIARAKRLLFEALVEEGFSEDAALRIVAGGTLAMPGGN